VPIDPVVVGIYRMGYGAGRGLIGNEKSTDDDDNSRIYIIKCAR
jgi:hypothetical protein